MSQKLTEIEIAQDRCRMETIYDVFDRLSLHGKGICLENLIRKLSQEKNNG